MQTINQLVRAHIIILLAAVTIFTGCTPPGPRALLEGKRLIDKGQYAAAVEELRLATKLMGTNALAWNYLGLACHHSGASAEAAQAYQRALVLDRDLSEAHFNLGCLWLEENKLEGAKAEFLAYTLRRANSVEGLAKLGIVQLQLREISDAERSFAEVLKLSTNNVEALTGLGLAKAQRGRPVEAAQFFNAALRADPGCQAALLNLAIVAHQQLRDRALALQKYRDYLALKPAPADAEAIQGVVRQLEKEAAAPALQATNPPVGQFAQTRTAPVTAAAPVSATVSRTPNRSKVEPTATPSSRTTTEKTGSTTVTSSSKPAPVTNEAKPQVSPAAKPPAVAQPKPAAPPPEPKPAVVEIASAPVPKAGQDITLPKTSPPVTSQPETKTAPKDTTTSTPTPRNRTLAQKIFGGGRSASQGTKATVTATPANSTSSTRPPDAKAWPRYAYRNPVKPAKGDTAAAQRAFAQGLQAHQAQHLPEAIQAYRAALQSDPSFFDAQYHLGVAGTQSGNLRMALGAYEGALAAKPDSADARYNFAIVLKQSGYPVDSANELQTLLTKYPTDARAHVALGNLYAQQLGDTAKARQHYLRVLETDPRHPQAAQIRYWLADNPK
jgi:tetratricopeptide (TPR) repeat protein